MFAALQGDTHIDAIQLLLDNGADPTITDQKGKSALDYAREKDAELLVGLFPEKKYIIEKK